ncbi:hypothetical protein N7462_008863 [Penicillium macrosclerotiorum]|uniref:uncharacterized protein n=1 Tax=Penicillium macrosclerotiorum TaxID=303699 RepID=UPI0025499908|nr:uncharacterized protein N7462_008863 [Penicillium macrosclerotiorum]KAJ5675966.1 hypothetical protein N7462_008863 [Penicillium macrosclerotiorum]
MERTAAVGLWDAVLASHLGTFGGGGSTGLDGNPAPAAQQLRLGVGKHVVAPSKHGLNLHRVVRLHQYPLPEPRDLPGSSSRKQSWQLYDEVIRLELTPSMTISFVKNGQLFKLRYTYIDLCKDTTGALKCLELGGGFGQQAPFVHAFHNTKLPVPHLEHPKESDDYPLRVSFLEHQTVQTAQVVFMTQLSYKFENWDDCVRFQELLLGSKLTFIGGMAEAKSKGRGEECISQNIRILRGHNNKRVLLYFANSQRGPLKRYVSIPLNCIASVKPPKKAGRPMTIELNPNFEILSQMRNLQITFLDDNDCKEFCQLLSTDLTIG